VEAKFRKSWVVNSYVGRSTYRKAGKKGEAGKEKRDKKISATTETYEV